MGQLIPQPSINDVRTQALLGLIDRLDAVDLTTVLTNRIDSVPDSALVFLAWQWDMLSPEWQLLIVETESIDALTNIDTLTDWDTLSGPGSPASDYDSMRALLKVAIPLHSIIGTPGAIKSALGNLGWKNVTLLEGQSKWGGVSWPTNEAWAVFRVLINIGAGQAVLNTALSQIVAAVTFFKNERSWLDSVIFIAPPLEDAAPVPTDYTGFVEFAPAPTDFVNAPTTPLADTYAVSVQYNNRYLHTGFKLASNPQPGPLDSGISVNGVTISGTITGSAQP